MTGAHSCASVPAIELNHESDSTLPALSQGRGRKVKQSTKWLPRHREAVMHCIQSGSNLGQELAESMKRGRIILPSKREAALQQQALSAARSAAQAARQAADADIEAEEAHTPVEEEDVLCALCCNVYIEPIRTPCNHIFCRKCLVDALKWSQKCALCRAGFSATFTATARKIGIDKPSQRLVDRSETLRKIQQELKAELYTDLGISESESARVIRQLQISSRPCGTLQLALMECQLPQVGVGIKVGKKNVAANCIEKVIYRWQPNSEFIGSAVRRSRTFVAQASPFFLSISPEDSETIISLTIVWKNFASPHTIMPPLKVQHVPGCHFSEFIDFGSF